MRGWAGAGAMCRPLPHTGSEAGTARHHLYYIVILGLFRKINHNQVISSLFFFSNIKSEF